MSLSSEILPLLETRTPATPAELASAVSEGFEASTPIYPIGGGTSLDFGLTPRTPGIGLALTGLGRVVDFPARDLTITVEAGVTFAKLASTLAAEGQRLPIDVPFSARATVGGGVAANASGPRRYGHRTLRDYVIGISAVDGRGTPFKAGGRVVKNVAGYDFCKLLTGSLGTLAVITQLTLKVKPIAGRAAWVVAEVADWPKAETLLAALVDSKTSPTAIELLTGPTWRDDPMLISSSGGVARLLVGLEGTAAEVDWMVETLMAEWRALGVTQSRAMPWDDGHPFWTRLVEFPAQPGPLVLKANLPPHQVVDYIRLLLEIDPQCSIESHAGNGIVLARMSELPSAGLSRMLVGRLQPAAMQWGGNLTILSTTAGEQTRQAVWGGACHAAPLMEAVKKQFDPRGILNPGRFVYANP